MQSDAQKPTNYGKMDTLKKKWVERLGLVDAKSVIDCDITAGRVQMLVDGEVVTRQVCQRYSRIMGYFRPISTWNIGKQQEQADRQYFVEPM